MNTFKLISAIVIAGLFSSSAIAASDTKKATTKMSSKELSSRCAMLDDTKKRPRMDALLNKLLVLCDRTSEFGGVESEYYDPERVTNRIPGTDVEVNDDTGESGATQTQNETSIALNENTGTICSGYNDAWSGVVAGGGFTGFSRSTDGGASFDDNGAFDANSFGDPSMQWRRADGNFYLATLHSDGLGVYRSTDDCQTFTLRSLGHVGGSDDKELLAIDNTVSSDYYGRMHLVWINFDDARIYATYSDDGLNWSTPVPLSDAGSDTQGAYPIITTDGRLYVAWVRWNPFFSGPMDIEIARSDDGGDTFTRVTNPVTGVVNPYASGPTGNCGRPALNGNIRYLSSPQIAVTPNGDLHAVYTYDPDGRDVGDVIDVYYRRSTDMGATWLPEVRVNDDATTTDQFFPSISAGPTGRIVIAWYDRRLDEANNLFFDYYSVMSEDGGASFGPNVRISDESSPVYIDPGLAACYHGDYDQQIQTASSVYLQWADDRTVNSGHADPNVFFDEDVFEPDFFLGSDNSIQEVCAPDTAVYGIDIGQALGFSDPVTLSVDGVPAGMTSTFSTNPVTPEGSSNLTIGNTAAGPAGTYNLDVTGTSGAKDRAVQLVLSVATSTPGATTLLTPANGATEQPSSPTFAWAASSQASTYTIEIATDAAFNNMIAVDQVAGTSYTLPASLSPQTTYYWRVRAANICGINTPTAGFSFTTQNIVCVNSGQAIPDNSAAGLDSATTVGLGGEIEDLNVSLNATHTYVGDLIFTLTHEDSGTSVVMVDRPGVPASGFGCSNNDVDATLDDDSATPVENECAPGPALTGVLSPNNPLSAFNGLDLAGTWTLNVSDNAGIDTGTLNEWCLIPALADTAVDSDGDGVGDDVDNCTNVANADQIDSNGDGFGNACDADTNNDCIVNFTDIQAFSTVFNTTDADNDFNGDGAANFLDYAYMTSQFLEAPGPSALASCASN
ncbi:MAG: proprotein convertase P-domain-containing protein [Pseudomonadota bacterium]